MLGHYLSGAAFTFVESQINLHGKKARGRRWSSKDKATALSLLHSSSKSYQLLSKIFTLPTIKTLQTELDKVNIIPGFSPILTGAFAKKVSAMTDADKNCELIFDELNLKCSIRYDQSRDCVEGIEDFETLGKSSHAATSATVFLCRGLKNKWKQPLGYFLTSGSVSGSVLKELIIQALDICCQIGLKPKVLICDQGPNNQACLRNCFKVTISNPYFFKDGNKVIVFWDPPHLLKNIRNNLKNNGFSFQQHKISWRHIESFYLQDCKTGVRVAPKLRKRHMKLPSFKTMHVRTACQTLSQSVAKGIKLYIALGFLPTEASFTAEFCERFDNLFNCFNSSSRYSTRPFNNAITKDSSHWQYLDEVKLYLEQLKPASRDSLTCIDGWLSNINALKMLMESLNFDYLIMNRLNQDCIENMFFSNKADRRHMRQPRTSSLQISFTKCNGRQYNDACGFS